MKHRNLNGEHHNFKAVIYKDGIFDSEMGVFLAVGLDRKGGLVSSLHAECSGEDLKRIVLEAHRLIVEISAEMAAREKQGG